MEFLKKLGIGVTLLARSSFSTNFLNRIKRKFYPSFADLFPFVREAKPVQQVIQEVRPDILGLYHWEALAATSAERTTPKIGLVGDPVDLPDFYRRQLMEIFQERRPVWRELKNEVLGLRFRQKYHMHWLLNGCQVSGAFAAHHARMFQNEGIQHCRYFHTPVPDPGYVFYEKRQLPFKPKILLLGHLKGIATLSGIELFAEEIFPGLCQALGENFEVHVVGGFFESMPERLKTKMMDPRIIIKGHIHPIDPEFLHSHVLLVPTTIHLGIRVRILTAFSFGTPVVAHVANQLGIPELEHEKNALLGADARGIVAQVVRLLADPLLGAQLSRTGRQTYEKYFSVETAGHQIVSAAQGLIVRDDANG